MRNIFKTTHARHSDEISSGKTQLYIRELKETAQQAVADKNRIYQGFLRLSRTISFEKVQEFERSYQGYSLDEPATFNEFLMTMLSATNFLILSAAAAKDNNKDARKNTNEEIAIPESEVRRECQNQNHLQGAVNPMKTLPPRFSLLKLVSNVTPWVAPFPSAFFVARSAMKHLDSSLFIAVILAAVIELLGLTSVHTWLWLSNWNSGKRKTDPKAPTQLAILLIILYFLITTGMIVVLEVLPALAPYMPAITPLLTIVGAFNLALISQQERREAAVRLEREERKTDRLQKRSMERSGNVQQNVQGSGQRKRRNILIDRSKADSRGEIESGDPVRILNSEEALNALVNFFEQNPTGSYSAAGRSAGRSKSWVVWALNELEKTGRIKKADGKGVVLVHERIVSTQT